MTGRMIPTRTTEDLLLGSWELIQQLGRVPRRLIWDNEPGIGRGQRRAEGLTSFMGTLATKLVLLPPRDLESASSPNMPVSGPGERPSPTLRMSRLPVGCASSSNSLALCSA